MSKNVAIVIHTLCTSLAPEFLICGIYYYTHFIHVLGTCGFGPTRFCISGYVWIFMILYHYSLICLQDKVCTFKCQCSFNYLIAYLIWTKPIFLLPLHLFTDKTLLAKEDTTFRQQGDGESSQKDPQIISLCLCDSINWWKPQSWERCHVGR